ncbi:hypothetical protein [Cryptosporangium sp. NPDC048952]|uniref:hypothetical protein n=1 Tax=Cryptosporangium sp. NPDC048952 TaxID=3363961 RepID=UPI0037175D2B
MDESQVLPLYRERCALSTPVDGPLAERHGCRAVRYRATALRTSSLMLADDCTARKQPMDVIAGALAVVRAVIAVRARISSRPDNAPNTRSVLGG